MWFTFFVRIQKKFFRLEPENTVKETSTNLRNISGVYGGKINSEEEICYYIVRTQAVKGFMYDHFILAPFLFVEKSYTIISFNPFSFC